MDKYLADMQIGTRSEVKELIRKKCIRVNGALVSKPDIKVNPATDEISLNNEIIKYEEFEYFMLNKPAGVLSAAKDPKAVTVVDLITEHKRKELFPVGRLDKDTEGLMLITNDGELSHRLMSPKKHVDKTYYVKVYGKLTNDIAAEFAEGIDINICKCADDKVDEFPKEIYHTRPAKLQIISSGEYSEAVITLHEGKFHQIKRMFAQVGCKVTYLRRIALGTLRLDYDLKPGEYRKLTSGEVAKLTGFLADGPYNADGADNEKNTNSARNRQIAYNIRGVQNNQENILEKMLDNIKGVIFDMDGTLLDSMEVWKQIDLEFLGERGIIHPEGMEKEIEGMSFHETAVYFKDKFQLTETLEQIEEIWHNSAYVKYVSEIELKPCVREFLSELKRRKIKLGIATSNSRELTDACLEALGIKQMFDTIVTGSDVNHGKPDPEIYLTAAENMSLFPRNCLVFEDVVMGLLAGVSAGMRTCAVYDDFSKAYDEEKKKIADYYINSFEDLNLKNL